VFNSAGTDLTPCSPSDVASCDTTNGQSGSSNEHMEFGVTTAGTYYVVVMGFGPAENSYDIVIGLL
jgi:hypothetical protein